MRGWRLIYCSNVCLVLSFIYIILYFVASLSLVQYSCVGRATPQFKCEMPYKQSRVPYWVYCKCLFLRSWVPRGGGVWGGGWGVPGSQPQSLYNLLIEYSTCPIGSLNPIRTESRSRDHVPALYRQIPETMYQHCTGRSTMYQYCTGRSQRPCTSTELADPRGPFVTNHSAACWSSIKYTTKTIPVWVVPSSQSCNKRLRFVTGFIIEDLLKSQCICRHMERLIGTIICFVLNCLGDETPHNTEPT